MGTREVNDLQAAERIFKKIVHPGLNSMRLDPHTLMQGPVYTVKQNKTYTLSPRGVPTRATNHIYSGCNPNRYSGMIGLNTSEMFAMLQRPPGTMTTSVANGNRSPDYRRSSLPSRKRAISSKTVHSMAMTKSASSDRYMSDIGPDPHRHMKSAQSDHWNKSEQGTRLDREWSSLSNSRALKRSSEILSHRVDRMYFMNGNSIQLKPRYQVDDDELNRLRELTKSRQSNSRQRPSRASSRRLSSKLSMAKTADVESVKEEQLTEVNGMADVNNRGRKSPLAGWGNHDNQEDELSVQGQGMDLPQHRPDGRMSRISNDDQWKTRKEEDIELALSVADQSETFLTDKVDAMPTMAVTIESKESVSVAKEPSNEGDDFVENENGEGGEVLQNGDSGEVNGSLPKEQEDLMVNGHANEEVKSPE